MESQEEDSHVCILFFSTQIINFSSFLSSLPRSIIFVWRPLDLLLQQNRALLYSVPVLQCQPRAAGRSAAVFSELTRFPAMDPFPRPVFWGTRPGHVAEPPAAGPQPSSPPGTCTKGQRASPACVGAQPRHFTTVCPFWH